MSTLCRVIAIDERQVKKNVSQQTAATNANTLSQQFNNNKIIKYSKKNTNTANTHNKEKKKRKNKARTR